MGIITIPEYTSDLSSRATIALDNLNSVSINTSLISDTDSTDDLGSSSKYWANSYIDKVYTPAIKFPSVQIEDSDVNVLDDYEEGTWEASFSAATSGTITINSSYKTGSYVKIGKQVTICGYFEVSSVSSPVGGWNLNGLPFVNGNNDYNYQSCNTYVDGLNSTAITSIVSYVAKGGSYIRLTKFASGSISSMSSDVKAGTILLISASYFIS